MSLLADHPCVQFNFLRSASAPARRKCIDEELRISDWGLRIEDMSDRSKYFTSDFRIRLPTFPIPQSPIRIRNSYDSPRFAIAAHPDDIEFVMGGR